MGDYFRNNIRDYYACMTGVDENVGRLIEELKRLKLFDNTIVVFTSDHGICMGDRVGKVECLYFLRNVFGESHHG